MKKTEWLALVATGAFCLLIMVALASTLPGSLRRQAAYDHTIKLMESGQYPWWQGVKCGKCQEGLICRKDDFGTKRCLKPIATLEVGKKCWAPDECKSGSCAIVKGICLKR